MAFEAARAANGSNVQSLNGLGEVAVDDEIPYASTVVVEQFHDFPNKVIIAANIWLEKKSQKPIVIGKDGKKIKAIRISAEKEVHKILEKRVKIDLWIKIKPNWRKKQNALKEFGYR